MPPQSPWAHSSISILSSLGSRVVQWRPKEALAGSAIQGLIGGGVAYLCYRHGQNLRKSRHRRRDRALDRVRAKSADQRADPVSAARGLSIQPSAADRGADPVSAARGLSTQSFPFPSAANRGSVPVAANLGADPIAMTGMCGFQDGGFNPRLYPFFACMEYVGTYVRSYAPYVHSSCIVPLVLATSLFSIFLEWSV